MENLIIFSTEVVSMDKSKASVSSYPTIAQFSSCNTLPVYHVIYQTRERVFHPISNTEK